MTSAHENRHDSASTCLENIEQESALSKPLSIVVPVFNEKRTVAEVLHRLKELPGAKEIIVVDDASSDGSREILAGINGGDIKKVFLETHQGKGAALRAAFQEATGDVVVIHDADLEYDPLEIAELVRPIREGHADVAYGSRLSGAKPHRAFLFWHWIGNCFLTFVTNLLFNSNLTDMETGSKAFRREILKSLRLRSNSFAFEAEFTAKILKRGYRVYEIPVSYYGRDYSQGKKIGWWDGVVALFTLLRYRLMD